MDVRRELTSTVGVAEKVADNGEDGTEGLEGNVPAGADDLRGCQGGLRRAEQGKERTPRTMPVGKIMPKARIWMAMCTHSVES